MPTQSITRASILVANSDFDAALGLGAMLESEGYAVQAFDDGEAAANVLTARASDLAILDLSLPALDGLQIIRRVRLRGIALPIIAVSDTTTEVTAVAALRSGADDFIRKPLGAMELVARIECLLRRTRRDLRQPIQAGPLTIDQTAHTVTLDGEAVRLTPKEYDLLLALVRRAGTIMSRTELLTDVWQHSSAAITRTVDTHVAELRRKVDRNPAAPLIDTVRKRGYIFKGSVKMS
jgi:DNA-binding response OmpR family regulator